MNWTAFLLYNAMGAISLAIINAFFKANPWNLPVTWLIAITIPFTAAFTQYGFVNAYQLAPSFFVAWFIGSAFCSVSGFLTSLFIFGEQVRLVNITGILFILGGSWLLTK